MDSKERKLVIVLLAISFSMLISGCFFVPFAVHVWSDLASLAGEKDVFLASILVLYFMVFALVGAALGLWINAYLVRIVKVIAGFIKRLINLMLSAAKK